MADMAPFPHIFSLSLSLPTARSSLMFLARNLIIKYNFLGERIDNV